MPLIESEVRIYIETNLCFKRTSGVVNISSIKAEIIIFTTSRILQEIEVREKLNSSFAKLYHDLDFGFNPINFLML